MPVPLAGPASASPAISRLQLLDLTALLLDQLLLALDGLRQGPDGRFDRLLRGLGRVLRGADGRNERPAPSGTHMPCGAGPCQFRRSKGRRGYFSMRTSVSRTGSIPKFSSSIVCLSLLIVILVATDILPTPTPFLSNRISISV